MLKITCFSFQSNIRHEIGDWELINGNSSYGNKRTFLGMFTILTINSNLEYYWLKKEPTNDGASLQSFVNHMRWAHVSIQGHMLKMNSECEDWSEIQFAHFITFLPNIFEPTSIH